MSRWYPIKLLCVCLLASAHGSVNAQSPAQAPANKSISSTASTSSQSKSEILPQNRIERQSVLELALIGRINLNPSLTRRLRNLDKLVLTDIVTPSQDISGKPIRRSASQIEKDLLRRVSRNQIIEGKEGYKLIKRAEANIKLRRYTKALEVYDLILRAYPAETSSLLGRAECYYSTKRYKDAIAVYKDARKVLAKDQNSMRYRPLIMKNIADACYREKDYFESANIYNLVCNGGSSRLIKIDFTGQASRGKSLFTVGDYKKSAKSFRKALKYAEKLHGKPFVGTTGNDDLERRVEKLEDRMYDD